MTIFGRKLIFFFCAGNPATPDMLLQYNCKHVSVGPSPTPAVVNDPTNRSCILSAKSWQFMTIFGRKLIFFFCAGNPATPDMLLQYNCKHVSVGPSPTPAVVNDLTKLSCILSAEHWQFLAIVGRTDFFFVLAALQPPICCSNTAANTLQWVRPRPRRSSMILQNSRAFFRQKIGNFWPLLGELIFFLCWRPCNPRYVAPIQLQTRFNGSVPDPGGRQ